MVVETEPQSQESEVPEVGPEQGKVNKITVMWKKGSDSMVSFQGGRRGSQASGKKGRVTVLMVTCSFTIKHVGWSPTRSMQWGLIAGRS
jgi:hypothetical protein